MRYMVRTSYVDVIGPIWMPSTTAAMRYTVDGYDIENMRDEDGNITRDSVEQWLACNSGDFQNVTDFSASIEDGDTTVDIPWKDEDSELTYNDCMFPEED
jgi:hypothetical protein